MERARYKALTQAIEERMRALMQDDPEGSFEVRFKLSQALIGLKMWWDEGRGASALPMDLDELAALGVVLPPMGPDTDDAAPSEADHNIVSTEAADDVVPAAASERGGAKQEPDDAPPPETGRDVPSAEPAGEPSKATETKGNHIAQEQARAAKLSQALRPARRARDAVRDKLPLDQQRLLWRAVLEIDPTNVEAGEALDEITLAEWERWIHDRQRQIKTHQKDLEEKALTDLLREVREQREALSQLPREREADFEGQLDALEQEVLGARMTVRDAVGKVDTADEIKGYEEGIAILESLPSEIYVDGQGQEHDRLERINELRKGQADFLRRKARERLGDAEQSLPAHPDTAAAYLQEGLDLLNKVATGYLGETWKELRDELERRQRQVEEQRKVRAETRPLYERAVDILGENLPEALRLLRLVRSKEPDFPLAPIALSLKSKAQGELAQADDAIRAKEFQTARAHIEQGREIIDFIDDDEPVQAELAGSNQALRQAQEWERHVTEIVGQLKGYLEATPPRLDKARTLRDSLTEKEKDERAIAFQLSRLAELEGVVPWLESLRVRLQIGDYEAVHQEIKRGLQEKRSLTGDYRQEAQALSAEADFYVRLQDLDKGPDARALQAAYEQAQHLLDEVDEERRRSALRSQLEAARQQVQSRLQERALRELWEAIQSAIPETGQLAPDFELPESVRAQLGTAYPLLKAQQPELDPETWRRSRLWERLFIALQTIDAAQLVWVDERGIADRLHYHYHYRRAQTYEDRSEYETAAQAWAQALQYNYWRSRKGREADERHWRECQVKEALQQARRDSADPWQSAQSLANWIRDNPAKIIPSVLDALMAYWLQADQRQEAEQWLSQWEAYCPQDVDQARNYWNALKFAIELVEEGRCTEASRFLSQAETVLHSDSPEYTRRKQYLDGLRRDLVDGLMAEAQAMRVHGTGSSETIVNALASVLDLAPNHPVAKEELRSYGDTLQSMAEERIEAVQGLSPDDQELASAIKQGEDLLYNLDLLIKAMTHLGGQRWDRRSSPAALKSAQETLQDTLNRLRRLGESLKCARDLVPQVLQTWDFGPLQRQIREAKGESPWRVPNVSRLDQSVNTLRRALLNDLSSSLKGLIEAFEEEDFERVIELEAVVERNRQEVERCARGVCDLERFEIPAIRVRATDAAGVYYDANVGGYVYQPGRWVDQGVAAILKLAQERRDNLRQWEAWLQDVTARWRELSELLREARDQAYLGPLKEAERAYRRVRERHVPRVKEALGRMPPRTLSLRVAEEIQTRLGESFPNEERVQEASLEDLSGVARALFEQRIKQAQAEADWQLDCGEVPIGGFDRVDIDMDTCLKERLDRLRALEKEIEALWSKIKGARKPARGLKDNIEAQIEAARVIDAAYEPSWDDKEFKRVFRHLR
jgi:hypothetical protein